MAEQQYTWKTLKSFTTHVEAKEYVESLSSTPVKVKRKGSKYYNEGERFEVREGTPIKRSEENE